MGHILNKEGVKADPLKIKAMIDMPEPSDKKALMRFLGLVTYVGKFIPNLSTLDAPVRSLLKKESNWAWEENHRKCFKKLKHVMSENPVLKYFNVF